MALKDVKKYYKQIESTYIEMANSAKDFDEALKDGFVTQEQFDQASQMFAKIKENYDRITYIMYLFMQPARKQKVAKYKKINNKGLSYLESNKADLDSVYLENSDVLKEFKQLMGEINNGKNN